MINLGVRQHPETALAIAPRNAETKMDKLRVGVRQGKYSNQFQFLVNKK